MGGLARCDGCGSILWNVLGRGDGAAPECPTCGQPMKAERRRPGRRFALKGAERRDAVAPKPVRPAR
jgi:predicted nucleic acid-binding Zn ribbon protein